MDSSRQDSLVRAIAGIGVALGIAGSGCSPDPLATEPGSREWNGFVALSGRDASELELAEDLRLERTFAGRSGQRIDRYQQVVDGVKVQGAQVSVRSAPGGETTAVIGTRYSDLIASNVIAISADDARAIAATDMAEADVRLVELRIDPADGALFYHVDSRGPGQRWIHWVDAETGAVRNRYDALTTGSGIGINGEVRDLTGLTVQFDDRRFLMHASTRRQFTFDAGSVLPLELLDPVDDDDLWDSPGRRSPGHPAIVDAQYHMAWSDLYLLTLHGFDLTAALGHPMFGLAHYGVELPNAFWQPASGGDDGFFAFGDGDGTTFREFVAVDIVGHEVAHAVTTATSDLEYQNEPGALNEAFSDIVGVSVELFADNVGGSRDLVIGEDSMIDGTGFRSMNDPARFGQPDHMTERFTGPEDNGGVHINSGIVNHAWFLLSQGGSNAGEARGHLHTGPVVPFIGASGATEIFFDGFTSLPSDATICQARLATEAVASDVTRPAVAAAWRAVGVGNAACGIGCEDDIECDDGLSCTQDRCIDKVCVNAGEPMDGTACRVADACSVAACSAGACVATGPVECEDDNPCTSDSCTGGVCGFDPVPQNGEFCDDDNRCTLNDQCFGGNCMGNRRRDCDDDNPCTVDSCDPDTGCVHDAAASDGATCDDGNACTTGEVCGAGSCGGGGAVTCDDGNGCTADACNPASGCVFDAAARDGATCDDGNACTTSDSCSAGACAGPAVDCSDGNDCTTDSCDTTGACVHVDTCQAPDAGAGPPDAGVDPRADGGSSGGDGDGDDGDGGDTGGCSAAGTGGGSTSWFALLAGVWLAGRIRRRVRTRPE